MSGIDFYVTLTKLSFGTYLSGYKITDDGLSETGRDFVWHEEKRVLDLLNVSSLEEFEKIILMVQRCVYICSLNAIIIMY